jgi:two-component system, chemotaxis family, protein-glutamate methylesterase/glutaminase
MENRTVTKWTCPECRGPLEESANESVRLFHCRVGHVYSSSDMVASHSETLERVLWEAVVALDEHAEMLAASTEDFPEQRGRLESKAKTCQEGRSTLQRIITSLARS